MIAKKPESEKIANIPPFGLRMHPDLKQRIAAAAEANGRSLNAEIVVRLEQSLADDQTLQEHEDRIGELESAVEWLSETAGRNSERD